MNHGFVILIDGRFDFFQNFFLFHKIFLEATFVASFSKSLKDWPNGITIANLVATNSNLSQAGLPSTVFNEFDDLSLVNDDFAVASADPDFLGHHRTSRPNRSP